MITAKLFMGGIPHHQCGHQYITLLGLRGFIHASDDKTHEFNMRNLYK